MNNKEFVEERNNILKGLEEAYARMVKFKKQKGTPLVISENGKVKLIPSEEILPTTSYE